MECFQTSFPHQNTFPEVAKKYRDLQASTPAPLSFPQDSHLCVVQCLEVMKKYRNLQVSTLAPLFLSSVKPHKPVTSQRIEHWIKDTLKEARVDTNTYKALSVRRASISVMAYILQMSRRQRIGAQSQHFDDSITDHRLQLRRTLPRRCSVLRLTSCL